MTYEEVKILNFQNGQSTIRKCKQLLYVNMHTNKCKVLNESICLIAV